MRMPAEAVEAYGRARQLNPDMPLLKGNLLHQKMLVCDWQGTDALIAEIEADLMPRANWPPSRLAGRAWPLRNAACSAAPN
jgi:hypothetical protein